MFDMNVIYRYSSLGRTLDPRLPTNRLIAGLTLLAGLAGGLLALPGGGDLSAALGAGLWAGAAVFIAWALTREIDPDYPYSAFVSAGLALVACLLLGAPPLDLLALAAVVISLRLINRIVGPPFHWLDSLILLALALLLAIMGEGLTAVVIGVAFALDGLMLPPLRRHLAFAAVAIAAGIVALAAHPPAVARPEGAASNVLFVIVLAFGFLLITTNHVTSLCDVPEYRLSVARVQAAMVWLLAVAVLTGFTAGATALTSFLPVWAGLAGAALYRAGHLALKSLREANNQSKN